MAWQLFNVALLKFAQPSAGSKVGRVAQSRASSKNWEPNMRKLTAIGIGLALCTPSVGLAQDFNTDLLDTALLTAEFDTLEDCEDALAQARRDLRAENDYVGRDRGQSNKAFNQRYQCEEDDESGLFVIVDADVAV
jgi:hypothetical protein